MQKQDTCTLKCLPKKTKAAAVAVQKTLCLCTPWHWPKLTLKLCALYHNTHWSVRLQQSAAKYMLPVRKCLTPQSRHRKSNLVGDKSEAPHSIHLSFRNMCCEMAVACAVVVLKKLFTWKADLGSAFCSICSSSCASVTQEYNKLPSC